MCSHMAKNNFQANNNNNNKQRQLQLQFPSRGSSVRIIFLCSSSKPNTVPQTWPQGFKPRLGCSLFGIELLWSVSINYPDFTTVRSVPLFRVCRVITGRTCLKLLFSRWQSSNTQELVSPTMCLPHAGAYIHWTLRLHRAQSCYRPGCAAVGHGQSTAWGREASDSWDPESKHSVFEGKAVLTRHRVWLQMGPFPAARGGRCGIEGVESWLDVEQI